MRGCDAECFILRIAHCRDCCLCRTTLARSYSGTEFTRYCVEIVAGIVIGPAVFGWVKIDLPISILSVLGLAFLLFLAGLEVELERLRGRLLMFVGLAFLLSLGLALLFGYGLYAAGQVISPLLIAIWLQPG